MQAFWENAKSENEVIKEMMRQQLPSWNPLFYRGCFNKPTYHWIIICDLARVFEFCEISPDQWKSLHLLDSHKNDVELLEIVWIGDFISMPGDAIPSLIAHHREVITETSIMPKEQIQNCQKRKQANHIHFLYWRSTELYMIERILQKQQTITGPLSPMFTLKRYLQSFKLSLRSNIV